jgi:hypothetical protein
MSRPPTDPEQQPPENLQQISKWTRAYAQNRSLGFVVFMIIFVLLYAAIGGSSYLAGMAYRYDNMPLLCVSLALLVPVLGAVIYLSIPKWGGKLQQRMVKRLYAREGQVSFVVPDERKKFWALVLGVCFGTCIVASVAIDFVLHIPFQYMQPISALYCVPFLVGLWILMRPMAGYLTLLWPALYAMHAILIVAGAPIVFTGEWQSLNMLIPVAGYGMLTGVVSHLYSRIALRRLRRLTQTDLTGVDPVAEPSQQ